MIIEPFAAYKKFISDINTQVDKYVALHRPYLRCTKGCSACCIDFNILPVEYFYIQQTLENEGFDVENFEPENQDDSRCVFLKNHCCSIYQVRPYICRTHGLPLISMGDEEWELSACELNFTDAEPEYLTVENCFMQDKANNELFLINKDFLDSSDVNQYSHFDMIPIRKLVNRQFDR
jgi:uncharacterized protein